jgi:hypothetical protein
VAEPLRISLMRPPNHADHLVTALPRNVLAAGLVSFFTDLSSEMIVPVLPIFLTAVLGAPVAAVGLIEGVAESAASIVRVFAGSLSDAPATESHSCSLGHGLSGRQDFTAAAERVFDVRSGQQSSVVRVCCSSTNLQARYLKCLYLGRRAESFRATAKSVVSHPVRGWI